MGDQIERGKKKSQGFAAFGIPVGSVLVYKKDPAVTVTTLDDKNKVEYRGKIYSISTLAKQLVGSPVSGYLYFKFKGVLLKNLGKMEVVENSDSKVSDTSIETEGAEAISESNWEIDHLAGEVKIDSAG
jgi:hypothetical protein